MKPNNSPKEMEQDFHDKLASFIPAAELMPGVVILHEISSDQQFKTIYMSSRGLQELGVSLDELRSMGNKYHERFFNNDDMEDFIQKLEKLLENRDPNQTFTFFQQVKFKNRKDWVWHLCSLRIFHTDPRGHVTHLVTVALPVDQMKHIPNKAERLLAENTFYRKNLEKFASLGSRAKEVLRLVALGKSSSSIAEEMNISVETVHTHRKMIKKKLGISSNYDFTEYAHAFDLI